MSPGPPSLVDRLLKRILFVAAAPRSAATRIAGIDEQFVITALLNGKDAACSRALTRILLDEVAPALDARRRDWHIDSMTIQRGVPGSRPIVFFFELTRTWPSAAWLCHIAGSQPPPPFHLNLCPLYEAMIELRFPAAPPPEVIAGVHAILDAPAAFDPPVLIGSQLQVRVYDGDSTSEIADRVNICFLVRRPPGVTRTACQDYWRHQHAHLALENMKYLRLTRYRQVHTTATPLPGLDDTFDGVVYAEKHSFLQLFLDLLKPDTARFNSTVVVDECHFTESTPVTLMRRIAHW